MFNNIFDIFFIFKNIFNFLINRLEKISILLKTFNNYSIFIELIAEGFFLFLSLFFFLFFQLHIRKLFIIFRTNINIT
jgi:hypothetical protein